MMSGNNIFHSCWDNEPEVQAISTDSTHVIIGDAKFVREIIEAESDLWFDVTIFIGEESIRLPTTRVWKAGSTEPKAWTVDPLYYSGLT